MIKSMSIETRQYMSIAPPVWVNKKPEDIIKDFMRFVDKINKPTKKSHDKLKPYWSTEKIKDETELERLELIRSNISKYFTAFNEPVRFIGYKDTPRGKADRWYLPLSTKVLEIVSELEDIDIRPFPTEYDIRRLLRQANFT